MEKQQRVYVKVTSDFDQTGCMMPKAITWKDGRVFKIDSIRDFRPASTLGSRYTGNCYTVLIGGKEKHLFFERTNAMDQTLIGRWWVECPAAVTG